MKIETPDLEHRPDPRRRRVLPGLPAGASAADDAPAANALVDGSGDARQGTASDAGTPAPQPDDANVTPRPES